MLHLLQIAASNQNAEPGVLVTLNGGGSSDANSDLLTYRWAFTSKPYGSSAVLSSTTVVNPTFTPDKSGSYCISLVVNDGITNSAAATVIVSTTNAVPVANAGADKNVTTGNLLTLNGSGSSDANTDPLTYSWALVTKPAGSSSTLSNTTIVNPTFTPDIAGSYVFNLVVNDGKANSASSTVTYTASYPIIGDTFTSSLNIVSKVEELFYVRNANGTIYLRSGNPIIIAKITISNNSAYTLSIDPYYFHIIDGAKQIDYNYYFGITKYDYLGQIFTDNQSQNLLTTLVDTIYVAFDSSSTISSSQCYLASTHPAYPFKISFNKSEIK